MTVRREEAIRSAEKFVSKGRLDAAIKEYRKVLTVAPNDVNTLNRLGDLYARVQRFDEAVELFEKIAEGYTDDGFYVKAIAIYKKIIKLDPTRLEVYESLASLYHKQGLVNEARTQYQVLGDYHLKHNNLQGALGIYRSMVDLEPDNPSPRAKLADLFRQEGRIEEAMEEYSKIAELMLGHGEGDQAAQVYERALDLEPSDLDFIAQAVRRLREGGHDEAAGRFLHAARERNPGSADLARIAGSSSPRATRELKPQTAAVEESPEPPWAEEERATDPAFEAEPATPAPPETRAAAPSRATQAQTPRSEASAPGPAMPDATLPETPMPEAAMPEAGPPPASRVETSVHGVGEVAPPGGQGFEAGALEEEAELDLGDVFSLDLDDDEAPSTLVQPPPDMLDSKPAWALERQKAEAEEPAQAASGPPPVAPGPPSSRIEIDPKILEDTVAELEPERISNEDDLVSEAEVLAKYGLEDKAMDRLTEALSLNPHCLEAYELLVRLHLEAGRHQEVEEVGSSMAQAAAEVGGGAPWERTLERLEGSGFELSGSQVVAQLAEVEAQDELRIDEPPEMVETGLVVEEVEEPSAAALDEVVIPASDAPSRGFDKKKSKEVDKIVASLLQQAGGKKKPRAKGGKPPQAVPEPPPIRLEPPEPPPEPPAEPPQGLHAGEVRDITLGGIFHEIEVPEGQEPVPSAASWLDEVEVTDSAAAEAEQLFGEEDDFFDLAGELEQELMDEDVALATGEVMAPPREQTLEEIVEGFKKGVAESLSTEDYATHFNLGIAYREMGLLDEAIGEFQLAAKDRGHLVESCSMLGLSFLEKGLPELAVKWYRRGLDTPDLSEEESLGLLYEMGNSYLALGDREAAHEAFVEIYGVNSNYRDVVAKLEELA